MPHHAPPVAGPRRLPVPIQNPPFDDEIGIAPVRERARSGLQPAQDELAFGPRSHSRGTATHQVGAARHTDPRAAEAASRPCSPDQWCARFAVWAAETIYGQRALPQLIRWTSHDVYAALAERCTSRRSSATAASPFVRSFRTCDVRLQVFEAAVVIQEGDRTRALALRFELCEGRWVCTALDLV